MPVKYSQPETTALLNKLGVVSWDTFPPDAGVIRWFDGRKKEVASAKYCVILSFGPDQEYTMAWNIEAYRVLGLPFVPKAEASGPGHVVPATAAAAEHRAMKVGNTVGADFVYQCSTLWVAVFGFTESPIGKEQRPAADVTTRGQSIGRAVARVMEAPPRKKPCTK